MIKQQTKNKAKFQQKQFAFTSHIRNPDAVAKPAEIEDRRMAIYRELLFNNICGFLESGFPVLKSLYRQEDWLALARRFFADYRCHSPYFVDIPEAFVNFLQQGYQPIDTDPAFLLELAHYEWLELALMTSKDEVDWSGVDRHGDLLLGSPELSSLAVCQGYQWPVHMIADDHVPEAPLEQPLFMIVYRNDDDEVKFIEANPVTARLFEVLRENEQKETGQVLLIKIADELNHPNPDLVIQGGLQTLTRWHHLKIITGVIRKPEFNPT